MQTLCVINSFKLLCKLQDKWGLYISGLDFGSLEEVVKAAPYLKWPQDAQVLMDGVAFIFCDTEEEMNHLYDQTVGDDGPTKFNSYNGSARVYALTCDPRGNTMNENT